MYANYYAYELTAIHNYIIHIYMYVGGIRTPVCDCTYLLPARVTLLLILKCYHFEISMCRLAQSYRQNDMETILPSKNMLSLPHIASIRPFGVFHQMLMVYVQSQILWHSICYTVAYIIYSYIYSCSGNNL